MQTVTLKSFEGFKASGMPVVNAVRTAGVSIKVCGRAPSPRPARPRWNATVRRPNRRPPPADAALPPQAAARRTPLKIMAARVAGVEIPNAKRIETALT